MFDSFYKIKILSKLPYCTFLYLCSLIIDYSDTETKIKNTLGDRRTLICILCLVSVGDYVIK